MLIERAEQLKRELTDKYVVVTDNVAELRRFVGLTGRVKTVNMNCRALVEFDGPVDIGWYDIDPTYLRVVDEPVRKQATPAPAAEKKKSEVASAKPTGKSPLELARQQGAAGSAAAKPAAEGKKPSPLELARQQGAAKSSDATSAEKPAESKPSSAAQGGKKLSPLEMARQQGAAKRGDEPAAAATDQEESQADVATESQPAEPPEKPAPKADESTEGLSKLELARRQGPFKG